MPVGTGSPLRCAQMEFDNTQSAGIVASSISGIELLLSGDDGGRGR